MQIRSYPSIVHYPGQHEPAGGSTSWGSHSFVAGRQAAGAPCACPRCHAGQVRGQCRSISARGIRAAVGKLCGGRRRSGRRRRRICWTSAGESRGNHLLYIDRIRGKILCDANGQDAGGCCARIFAGDRRRGSDIAGTPRRGFSSASDSASAPPFEMPMRARSGSGRSNGANNRVPAVPHVLTAEI